LSVQQLLESPEPSDPQDATVAQHYLKDRKSFNAEAEKWTLAHASRKTSGEVPVAAAHKDAFNQLVAMGFEGCKVAKVLYQTGGDLNKSLENLLHSTS
jgi:ubiquitin-conjugating enzyme (huntingtin interacting protein 2)